MKLLTIFALAGLAQPSALASQDLGFDPAPTEACLAAISDGAQSDECIGRSTAICMRQPMGETTRGMAFCLAGEYDLWDAKLNAAYQALRNEYRAQDAERFPGAPSLADALREMQRSWITFRDARCGFETAQWHGGTGSSPAFLGCMMQATADQTVYLWSVLQTGR